MDPPALFLQSLRCEVKIYGHNMQVHQMEGPAAGGTGVHAPDTLPGCLCPGCKPHGPRVFPSAGIFGLSGKHPDRPCVFFFPYVWQAGLPPLFRLPLSCFASASPTSSFPHLRHWLCLSSEACPVWVVSLSGIPRAGSVCTYLGAGCIRCVL